MKIEEYEKLLNEIKDKKETFDFVYWRKNGKKNEGTTLKANSYYVSNDGCIVLDFNRFYGIIGIDDLQGYYVINTEHIKEINVIYKDNLRSA